MFLSKKVLGLFFFTSFAFAQKDTIKGKVFGSFESNSAYYNDDSRLGNFEQQNRFRSNNYLTINYNYNKFTAGIQAESYEKNALLNFNTKYKGSNIGTFFVNFKAKKIELTAGYFYEQFGSGLSLRTWEDRQLGINNAIRGIRIIANPIEAITLKALYGQQRSGFSVSDGKIFGFDADLDCAKIFDFKTTALSLGYSVVGRDDKILIQNPIFSNLTTINSFRINFSENSLYFSSEFNFKSKDAIVKSLAISNDLVKTGNAFLLNAGYSKKNFGLDVTIRRIENFSFLSERIPEVIDLTSTSLNFNDMILNYVPALTKQHHSNLANIYVYQAQNRVDFIDGNVMKAGETGGQLDFFYNFKKGSILGGEYGTKLSSNLSSWYNLPGTFSFFPADFQTDFLGRGAKYFSDYNFEIRKKFSEKFHTNFNYVNQYYNKRWIEGGDLVHTNVGSFEGTYALSSTKSIRIETEHLWTAQDNKNWAGGTIEYNFSKKYSCYFWDIYNYGNSDSKKQIHYFNLGGTYRKKATRIALNYGRQRGGLVCVGGVCRFVPESAGLTLSMNTSF